ncbi:MAG: DoxX family protein [Pyrinomonadaceae bacterium]
MSFLFLMLAFSILAYIPQFFLGDRQDHRRALRHGMAGGFTFTGIDHFVNAETRYVAMMPDFLDGHALPLVHFTGVAELAGAIGLVVPLAAYKGLGLPNLRKWAGIGLAIMLALLVIANVNVALRGGSVRGLEFGAWYYWVRPLFQPIFILWALYVSGVIWDRSSDLRARRKEVQRRLMRTHANIG